jgi:hypothetical protein
MKTSLSPNEARLEDQAFSLLRYLNNPYPDQTHRNQPAPWKPIPTCRAAMEQCRQSAMLRVGMA